MHFNLIVVVQLRGAGGGSAVTGESSFDYGTPPSPLYVSSRHNGGRQSQNDKSANVRNVARTADVHGQEFRGRDQARTGFSRAARSPLENGARFSRRVVPRAIHHLTAVFLRGSLDSMSRRERRPIRTVCTSDSVIFACLQYR